MANNKKDKIKVPCQLCKFYGHHHEGTMAFSLCKLRSSKGNYIVIIQKDPTTWGCGRAKPRRK